MFDISFYGNLLLQLIVLVYFVLIFKKLDIAADAPSLFDTIVIALLFFILFHTLTIIGNVGSPIGLLYGPLIYLASRSLIQRKASPLHLFPYLFFPLSI